ncbi:MAG: CDP-alcohol phosphatidyltransferase family protein [Actinobacteria bacterium]|nr:CDP-alcohol phosphatidyltransferase family protein [Actinomycetota bacterium]
MAKRIATKKTSGKRVTQGSLFTTSERTKIKRIGEPIALMLGRIGFSPDALTLVGFGIVLIATAQVALGNWAIAAGILIAGTLFDGLDGTLARATNRVTAFGAFFDSSLDRAAEAAIYAGIVYSAAVIGDIHIVTAATLALGIGSLVSYVRARGEGLGVSAHGGIAQRAERAVVLILGLLAAGITAETNYLLYALLIIVALSAVTVLQRILFIRAALTTSGRRA